MIQFKTITMLSLLTMLVLKDVLFVNFNNNLLGKISLIALTVYSFFHNKFVGVAVGGGGESGGMGPVSSCAPTFAKVTRGLCPRRCGKSLTSSSRLFPG